MDPLFASLMSVLLVLLVAFTFHVTRIRVEVLVEKDMDWKHSRILYASMLDRHYIFRVLDDLGIQRKIILERSSIPSKVALPWIQIAR
jgi:hypothetical protein